ncbi:MAG: DegQ family serine endoprotease [Desulforhopalus sp.]
MEKDTQKPGKTKRYGVKALLAAGLPFFVAGVFVTSGVNGIHSSIAGDITKGPHVTTSVQAAMPGSFAELAEKLSPTVVNVKVTKIEKADGFQQQFEHGPYGEFFGRFFEQMPNMPRNHRTQGAGSGVIISKDGYILSNNHVVEGAKEVTVTLADKSEYPAKVIGRDPKTDLAVLKIDADRDLPAAALGDSDLLKVGDWVVAIGNPFGLNHTVTSGIVSAKGRVIGAGPYDDFIQTDASINPGNSGGPLFNVKGEVVGINTAIIPQGQGIGFAIPVDTAKPLIPQLVSHGEITRGYLGVNIQTITPDLAEALNIDGTKGALVADVVPGSPADKSGLQRGDIIVDFNGKNIEDSHDLPAKVAATPVGEQVQVTVLREGHEKQLSVKVGKLSSDETLLGSASEPTKGKWGMQLHELNPQMEERYGISADQGVAVVGIDPDSAAAEAGIRQGDVIVEVNRHAVKSIDDVKKSISQAKDKDRLLLLVQRQNGKFYIPLEQHG